jgi:hypothetical protein
MSNFAVLMYATVNDMIKDARNYETGALEWGRLGCPGTVTSVAIQPMDDGGFRLFITYEDPRPIIEDQMPRQMHYHPELCMALGPNHYRCDLIHGHDGEHRAMIGWA